MDLGVDIIFCIEDNGVLCVSGLLSVVLLFDSELESGVLGSGVVLVGAGGAFRDEVIDIGGGVVLVGAGGGGGCGGGTCVVLVVFDPGVEGGSKGSPFGVD